MAKQVDIEEALARGSTHVSRSSADLYHEMMRRQMASMGLNPQTEMQAAIDRATVNERQGQARSAGAYDALVRVLTGAANPLALPAPAPAPAASGVPNSYPIPVVSKVPEEPEEPLPPCFQSRIRKIEVEQ